MAARAVRYRIAVTVVAVAALYVVGLRAQNQAGPSWVLNANSGTAGELATYAAAGGSTVVGPDAGLISSGTGTLTVGAVGVGTGQLTLAGTTSGSQNFHCTNATCTSLTEGGAMNFGSSVAVTGHLNQAAAGNWANSCTMTTTTCTFSILSTYTNYLCIPFIVSTPPVTANSASCALSGTTVTITAGITNTLTWGAVLIGNPN